jgi:hypothetical protein
MAAARRTDGRGFQLSGLHAIWLPARENPIRWPQTGRPSFRHCLPSPVPRSMEI